MSQSAAALQKRPLVTTRASALNAPAVPATTAMPDLEDRLGMTLDQLLKIKKGRVQKPGWK
jgi:hypothetical protein